VCQQAALEFFPGGWRYMDINPQLVGTSYTVGRSSFLNTRQTAEFQDVEDVIIEYNGGGLTVIEGAEAHYPVRLA
jgi:hypothetical protein